MASNAKELRELHRCFDLNTCRTHRLIATACRISQPKQPKRLVLWLVQLSGGRASVDLSTETQDIVRAAVVFLHASLESFLRGLAAYKGRPRGQETYNKTGQVKDLLNKLGVNYQEQERYLPSIAEMMQRRHDIVHRADLPAGETEPKRITFEDSDKIICWFFDVDFSSPRSSLGSFPTRTQNH